MIDSVRRSLGLSLGVLALLASLALPAPARAELQTIDFESGAALNAPLDGAGDVAFPRDPGFRPYRVSVGSLAHSGTTVGDIGRCFEESGDASGCEQARPHTTAVLDRTARSVSLYAGLLQPATAGDPPARATLTAYNSQGIQVATSGDAPVELSGFNTHLTVTSPAANIASFTVTANADLGIDDVQVDFAGSQPDFALSATNQVVATVQGQQTHVPLHLTRINGSNGPIRLSVAGLPPGVSGEFSAPIVSAGGVSSTLTLTADPDAPDTNFVPTRATITADPQGDLNVGPAPRTASLQVRVATSFGLSSNGWTDTDMGPRDSIMVRAPQCAPVDVPLTITRDTAMSQDISLSIRQEGAGAVGLPPGVHAQILDSPIVSPGGDVTAHRTLRFTVQPGTRFPNGGLSLLVAGKAGTDPDSPSRVLRLNLDNDPPVADIDSTSTGSAVVHAPRFGQDGSRVRIVGYGFCPGTSVTFAPLLKSLVPEPPVPATLIDDHTIEFTVPRHAVSGDVVIVPPVSHVAYSTYQSLTVDDTLNTDAFSFSNYTGGSLSWAELAKAFGDDDAYVSVNPCWPFGDCTATSDIPSPLALAEWPVLAAANVGGKCFGMALAVQDFTGDKALYSRYASPAPAAVHAIPSKLGPGPSLASFLSVEQVKQFSDEFASAYFKRSRSLRAQLDTIRNEFANHRYPMLAIAGPHFPDGHSVIAYDLVPTGRATYDILVYDPNLPDPGDLTPDDHRSKIDAATIHVDEAAGTWSLAGGFPTLWRGKSDGSLWAVPSGTMPANLSLPGLDAVKAVYFGSTGGAVVPASAPPAGAQLLPSSQGAGGSSGAWVTRADGPLSMTLDGVKAGSYSQMYTAPGFVASVAGVATAKGVRDTLTASGDALTLASGSGRPLTVALARRAAGATMAATVRTHASADGSDRAGLAADGAVSYAHAGAATQVAFSLTAVRRQGGPATFVSGPVVVHGGDRVTVAPLDRDLSRARVTIRDAHGRTTARVLRNRARRIGRLTIAAPRLAGRRVSVRTRLSGMHGRAMLGATLRLMAGRRVIARRTFVLKSASGSHTLAWRLPRTATARRYRLAIDVRAIPTAATGPATAAGAGVSAHRTATLALRR